MYAEPSGTTIASANCGAWSQTFTYDAFGNIKVFGSDDSEPLYTTNPQTNQIAEQGGTNPTYEADGNETKDYQGNLYAWNTYGRPTAIEGINITYDAMDRPVEQNRSGGYTPLQYSPSGFLMQLNAPSGQSSFVPVPAGGMAIWANNTIYYRHPEWLGSSRLTSDQNHNIYSDSAYSPFGEVYAQAGLSDESFGMDQSTVTNMYDFPARELAIVQSNCLSPDPAGLASVDPSDPQTWNRYAYVRNSPLTATDPTGMGGLLDGQPACISHSCQTRQIEEQAEMDWQNEESIYGYGGYNEFDTLSFALAPTCQNDCRVFYGNLDALGLVGLPGMSGNLEGPQDLLPPGPPRPKLRPPTEAEYNACVQQATSTRDQKIVQARAEQVFGGISILGAVGMAGPIFSTLNEAFFNEGVEGVIDFSHMGGFAYSGAAATFVPGYLYFKGTFADVPNTWNQYYANVISCAAAVPNVQ